MVFHQGGLSLGWSLIRMVFHKDGLSSGWSFIGVVCNQSLSLGWATIRMVFHKSGLLSGWSVIRGSTVLYCPIFSPQDFSLSFSGLECTVGMGFPWQGKEGKD